MITVKRLLEAEHIIKSIVNVHELLIYLCWDYGWIYLDENFNEIKSYWHEFYTIELQGVLDSEKKWLIGPISFPVNMKVSDWVAFANKLKEKMYG